MSVVNFLAMSLAVVLMQACSSGQAPEPPPPAKTVFDPLTQQLDKAREVQQTIDRSADGTRKAIDSQERGDSSP
jgi:hypothetical protein